MRPKTLTGYAAALVIVGLAAVLISYLAMIFIGLFACITSCYDIPGLLILYQTWWAMWNPNIQTVLLLVILISIAWTAYRKAESRRKI